MEKKNCTQSIKFIEGKKKLGEIEEIEKKNISKIIDT